MLISLKLQQSQNHGYPTKTEREMNILSTGAPAASENESVRPVMDTITNKI